MASSADKTSPMLMNLDEVESDPVLARIQPKGLPLLYEDEGLEMGESELHRRTCDILLYGVEFHLLGRRGLQVFGNLNLHYSHEDPAAYVSPDLMVVKPRRRLPDNVASYQIGPDGPAPLSVGEVLSFRTYQEGDLCVKPGLYGKLGIDEYILVDVSGELLPQRLLILRRQVKGNWSDEQDADGGVTSKLGFRLIIEADGQLRVTDETGNPYVRPREALAAVQASRKAEQRVRDLEVELERLRGTPRKTPKRTTPPKRRKKS
jgi:Uma2 family endonuclease